MQIIFVAKTFSWITCKRLKLKKVKLSKNDPTGMKGNLSMAKNVFYFLYNSEVGKISHFTLKIGQFGPLNEYIKVYLFFT